MLKNHVSLSEQTKWHDVEGIRVMFNIGIGIYEVIRGFLF